jgi:phenylacetate-coenzyme A ligase PaaK-like adenylate-forming protein
MNLAEIPNIQPYSLGKADKEKMLSPFLTMLSRHHYHACVPYRKMMNSIGFDPQKDYHYRDLMFLPVQLFRTLELRSVPDEEIVHTLASSGTSGKQRSKVFLDRETAANQTKVLTRIISSFIGTKRRPMIIIDSENMVASRHHLLAGAAGVLGFSLFGSKRMFALDEQMQLKTRQLQSFIGEHKGEPLLIFGFTFKVYEYLYKTLKKNGIQPDLSNAVLIHGGGWKKMERESVTAAVFRTMMMDVAGIGRVHDYYGMAEQTGSIFMACEYGRCHASSYGDIIIRRSEVLSILPKSYPGHSLLTDDTGILLGEDDCSCGRLGKYFTITGRISNAGIRGCSDAYEETP